MDREIEICVPSPNARLDILHKLLFRTPHHVTEDELRNVAYSAHGFVGADLASLCSRAAVHAVKRSGAGDGLCSIDSVTVRMEDLLWAMTQVKPSAMREVLIEVPNVREIDNRNVFSYGLLTCFLLRWNYLKSGKMLLIYLKCGKISVIYFVFLLCKNVGIRLLFNILLYASLYHPYNHSLPWQKKS